MKRLSLNSFGRKGQGMSVTTVILLVIGLVILVALIYGFMTGWSSFKKMVSPSNVDEIKSDCATACSLRNVYSYCRAQRKLVVNEDDLKVETSCQVLAKVPKFKKYGINPCPSVKCEFECSDIKINGVSASADFERDCVDANGNVKSDCLDLKSLVALGDTSKPCFFKFQ